MEHFRRQNQVNESRNPETLWFEHLDPPGKKPLRKNSGMGFLMFLMSSLYSFYITIRWCLSTVLHTSLCHSNLPHPASDFFNLSEPAKSPRNNEPESELPAHGSACEMCAQTHLLRPVKSHRLYVNQRKEKVQALISPRCSDMCCTNGR